MKIAYAYLVLAFSSSAFASDDARVRFQREYKPEPAHLAAIKRGLIGDITIVDYLANGVRTLRGDVKFNIYGYAISTNFRELKHLAGNVDRGTPKVDIGNKQYSALIEEKEKNSYAILEVFPTARENIANMFYYTASLYNIDSSRTYADLADDPGVEFVHYKDEIWNKLPVKTIRVRFPILIANTFENKVMNDYFFDPARKWLCIGKRERTQSKVKDHIYQEHLFAYNATTTDGECIPTNIEMFEVDEQKAIRKLTRSSSVVNVKPFSLAEGDFHLTAFGLPEPPGIAPIRTNWGYLPWLMLSVPVFLTLYFFFAWMRRRSTRALALRTPTGTAGS